MLRLLALFAILFATPAAAETEVDVELFLAVDVSRSMTPRELEIQRRGYAAALSSPAVGRAIEGGLLGRVAITYVEWAGAGRQRVVLDWTLLESATDAQAFAARLTSRYEPLLRRTSISSVLDFARDDIETNAYRGLRRVIDVSGDGPNNAGTPVRPARDRAVAAGIVINGLPLMTREGMGSQWHLDDLDEYYRACVIGGPGSFVIPVRDWDEFPEAVRQKLVQELANLVEPRHAQLSSATPDGGYDCMVGEKVWDRVRDLLQQP
ncbi:MAG: DUF1194 domain-containing protein [Pseudomonadota bacterium]